MLKYKIPQIVTLIPKEILENILEFSSGPRNGLRKK